MTDLGAIQASYFPIISLRPAEMRGLQELPEVTKDRIMPLVLFHPWLGAKKLNAASNRLKEAFGDRPFYLDLDVSYQTSSDREAVVEFEDMKSDLDAYLALVESFPHAIPTLRLEGDFRSRIGEQLQKFSELGRGFCLRLIRSEWLSADFSVLNEILESGRSDYIVFLDCEWSVDVVAMQMWCDGPLRWLASGGATVPVIPALASFPRSFDNIVGIKSISSPSRILYDNLRRQHNRINLRYGDWGTAKPRDDSTGRTPPPRIDYPATTSWAIARDKEKWNYRDAARELISSEFWNPELKLWGALQIEKTATGDPTGINSPQKNVAARINIHLHVQAWFDDPVMMMETDDPWPDDL